ncbi:hypothetical protein chiPu_0020164 [Chiloscyllium punctatum]|uniref:Uncharacterized protein n=1 Tax=Chiloscyllium punctatum TaxID=137246 RepID=A0A401RU54_CHIPU|nr:hypothetical protein [Chiloscyllium punctatum]
MFVVLQWGEKAAPISIRVLGQRYSPSRALRPADPEAPPTHCPRSPAHCRRDAAATHARPRPARWRPVPMVPMVPRHNRTSRADSCSWGLGCVLNSLAKGQEASIAEGRERTWCIARFSWDPNVFDCGMFVSAKRCVKRQRDWESRKVHTRVRVFQFTGWKTLASYENASQREQTGHGF